VDNDDKENEALDDRWVHGHGGRNDVGVMAWPREDQWRSQTKKFGVVAIKIN